MVISRITANDVLSNCRQILGLPVNQPLVVDEPLLSGLLRRSAGIHCPCSRTTLRTSLIESLEHLSADEESLYERIDNAIEALIVGGDLLELNDVVTEDMTVKGTWVFTAPPSFVVRQSHSIFLIGIVPDQDTFLPRSLSELIVYDGYIRMIESQPDRDIAKELRQQSLQQLSENAWLKCPKAEEASFMCDRFERLLQKQNRSGTVPDLEIIDPTRAVTFYQGRWCQPTTENGTFVARRRQEYGSPIWCFANLEHGVTVRLLDLPPNQMRWRGCDIAWHLQMAIDHCRGAPQRFRRLDKGDFIRFDFFSPIPQWSQRRLMIFGRSVPPANCLMSYLLPASEAKTEEQHLEQTLWLSPTEDSS